MQHSGMDALATAAEIAAILQAAEAVPTVQRRRASRKERQEAYLAYQRQAYRLMTGVNHLSVLVQADKTSWNTMAVAAIPMVGPFVDYVLPEKPSKNRLIREGQEVLQNAATLAKAATPIVPPTLAAVQDSDTRLRDRAVADMAAIGDVTAEFMAALAKVRLIGRPYPVAAADVIRALLQELLDRIPAPQPLYRRILPNSGKVRSDQLRSFNNCIGALGEAHSQLMSAVRADRPGRRYPWQVWRRGVFQVRPARELLAEADSPASGTASATPARREDPAVPK